MPLSERQQKMLHFIGAFIEEHNYPPSIRQIGAATGVSSTSVVNYNLNVLKREGFIERDPEISRGIRLVKSPGPGASLIDVPLLGYIAAGEPIPVPDSDFSPFDYETVKLTRDIVGEQEGIYALAVKGHSMIDALVDDGDIVIMQHQVEANNGDMVAVRLKENDETTLKYFYLEGDRVRLQPANPTVAPIYTHPANVEIQGKVVVVIRQL
jgi:repressor LexA